MMAQSKKSPVLEKGKKRRRIKQQKGLIGYTMHFVWRRMASGWPDTLAPDIRPWRSRPLLA